MTIKSKTCRCVFAFFFLATFSCDIISTHFILNEENHLWERAMGFLLVFSKLSKRINKDLPNKLDCFFDRIIKLVDGREE